MPKILKMPKRNSGRKPQAGQQAEGSKPPPGEVLQFPDDPEGDLQSIARWMSLADEVLGNNKTSRKKA